MKLPDKISNEDYVVDSDEIMEDATQETNTQNDKNEQEIEKMERAVAPAHLPWTVRGCCIDLDAAVAHCAKRTTSCSIFVIKSLSD